MSNQFQFPLTNCTSCPLSGKFGRGYEGDIDKADVILLGEAPGSSEERTGLPFQGVAGQLLRRVLKKYNFPFERAILTNPVLCKPPGNKVNAAMTKPCRVNMLALINAVQPKFLVLMGNTPLQAIIGKKGITKHRGSTIEMNNAQVFPIFHPSYINRKAGDKDLERVFDKDIEFVCNKVNGTYKEEVKDLHYSIVKSLEEFRKMIDHIHRTKMISIDLETTGLRHWQNKIRSIQFSPEEKWAYYVPILEHKENCLYPNGIEVEDINRNGKPRKTTLYPYWKPEEYLMIWESIRQILKNQEILKCGQNFKFDTKFLLHYLEPNNYDAEIKGFSFDTIFAFYLHNENSPNDLKVNSYLHFPDLRGYAQEVQSKMSDKDEEENDWTKIKLESLAPYGCGDADATLRLANLYSSKFFKTEEHAASMLQLFYNFYMPLSIILTKAERVGIGLDISRMEKVKIKYEKEKAEIEDEILIIGGKETDAVVRQRVLAIKPDLSEERLAVKVKDEKFNLNSPQQLGKLLFEDMKLPTLKRTDTGQPSTDKETLKILAIDYPFCRKVVKYRNRAKMISTYFDGSMKELESEGTIVKGFPMLHFTCNLIGTITGRTSYKRAPVQTFPREVDVRSIICAPPGYYLVEWDLKQIELVLAAWYSQDPIMLAEYKNNIDIHIETMKFMTGKSYEELMELKKTDPIKFTEIRKRAKGYNFGGLYEGGAETLASALNEKLEEGEAKITVEEAQAHINYFFSKYQRLKTYYDRLVQSATEKGYVKSCYGRVRRLPILTMPYQEGMKKEIAEAKRQAPNCVDKKTECLSINGWKKYNELKEGEEILTKNPVSGELEWNQIEKLNIYYNYQGPMYLFENGSNKKARNISALTTPDHRWFVKSSTRNRETLESIINSRNVTLADDNKLKDKINLLSREGINPRQIGERLNTNYIKIRRMLNLTKKKRRGPLFQEMRGIDSFITSEELFKTKQVKSIHLRGNYKGAPKKRYSDDLIEFIGWILTDGCMSYYNKPNKPRHNKPHHVSLTQSFVANPSKVERIEKLIEKLKFPYNKRKRDRSYAWKFPKIIAEKLDQIIPHKELSMNFLLRLTSYQLSLLLTVIQLGDGITITTVNKNHLDHFQALIVLANKSSNAYLNNKNIGKKTFSDKLSRGQTFIIKRKPSFHIKIHKKKYTHHRSTRGDNYFKLIKNYKGVVWCPTVKNSTMICRREDKGYFYQFITGQSLFQGTASDITKYSMIDLYNWITKFNKKSIISFDVHDSMLALVKEEELKDVVLMGKHFMEKERPPILRESIEIKAEAEVFRNWKIPISSEELESRGLSKGDLE